MSNLLKKASIVLTPTAYNDGEALCVKPEDGSGDFDFSRNSAATRVNAQGLVENVQTLSSNLVQNGDFSELGSEEVSNGSFSQEGVELVTNGSFDTDSDWDLRDAWVISNGVCSLTAPNSNYLSQSNVFTANKFYKLSFDIVVNSGSLEPQFFDGGFQTIGTYSTTQTVVVYFKSTTSGTIYFKPNSFDGSIDNVSVKEVGQYYTFGTGWGVAENEAVCDGTQTGNTTLVQQGGIKGSTINFVVGKTYKVNFDIVVTSGRIANVEVASAYDSDYIDTSGNHTTYLKASSTNNRFTITANSSFEGSVTNISVKEVLQDWSVEDYGAVSASAVITPNTEGVKLEKTVSADWRSSFLVQPISYTVGSQYKVTFKLKNGNLPSGGSVYVRRAYDSSSQSIVNNLALTNDWVEYTYYFVADSNSEDISFGEVNWQNAGVGQYFYIDDVSVIEITDDTNLPRINYEGFSYQDALGSELVTNGDFEDGGSNWSVIGVSPTFTNSTAVFENNARIYQTNAAVAGKKNKVVINFNEISGNGIRIYYGGGLQIVYSVQDIIDNGYKIEETIEFVGGETLYIYSLNLDTYAIIDNVSVKEYLGQEVVPDSGCGHYLWEPQSTNLITYSEDTTNWLTNNNSVLVTSNQAISPDGTLNADKLIPANGSVTSNGGRYVLFSSTAGTSYSVSVFVKQGEYRYVTFSYGSSSSYGFHFDLQDGVIIQELSNEQYTDISREVKSFGNGWYKLKISLIDNNSTSNRYISVRPANALPTATNNNYSTIGDGTSGIYAWGLQLEEQSYATSYIPTSGTSVTRNQDVCINGGSLASINSTEGVLYAEIAALANDGTYREISINDGTNDNIIEIRYINTDNTFQYVVRNNSAVEVVITQSLSDATEFNKFALKYKNNDFSAWLNGVKVGVDNIGTVPAGLDRLNFNYAGANPFFGKTKALVVYKEALSDEELALLTAPTPVDPVFTLDFDEIANQFTFNRASFATRVNPQGLIETVSNVGPEEVTNGNFDTDSDWVTNDWVISGGTLNGSASTGIVYQNNLGVEVGKTYKVVLEISNYTSGTIRFKVGGATYQNIASEDGVQEFYFVAVTTADNILFSVQSAFTGSIDNVSVKEYTEDDIPRIDYSTGEEAFLLEPQSTNLVTYSEDFSEWNNTDITFGTDGVSPSGETNANLIQTGTAGNDQVNETFTLSSTNTTTYSVFIKRISGADWVDFLIVKSGFSNSLKVWFDINNGTVGSNQANGTTSFDSASIQDYGNDWYRLIVTTTDSINNTSFNIRVRTASADGSDTRVNNSSYYLWGAQLEEQSYATSYIPTDGTTVTRVGETCVDATPEINSEEGVLYAEIAKNSDFNQNQIAITLSDGSSNNRVMLFFGANSTTVNAQVRSNSASYFSASKALFSNATNFNKLALKYKNNDFSFWVNGVKIADSISGNAPIGLNELNFTRGDASQNFFGKTKDIQIFTEALSDYQLTQLTTI